MADILNSPVQWDQLDKPNSPVRMRLSATVVSVVHDGPPERASHVVVTYLREGKLYRVRARGAILCGQQHANRHICRDISPEYREAMNHVHHAPMLTVNVALRNWRFLDRLGIASARWFEGFGWWASLRRNLEIPGQTTQPLDPAKPVVLTLYNPFPLPGVPFPQQCTAARMQLFGMAYADIERAVTAQFTRLFADAGFDARRDIAGIITNRWGHAYVVDPPGLAIRHRRTSYGNASTGSPSVTRSSAVPRCGRPLRRRAIAPRSRLWRSHELLRHSVPAGAGFDQRHC